MTLLDELLLIYAAGYISFTIIHIIISITGLCYLLPLFIL